MQRLVGVWGLVLGAGLLVVAQRATAEPASCTNFDRFGECIVGAQQPGSVGTPAPTPVSAAPDPATTCTDQGAVVPCEENGGRWVQSLGCYVSLLAPQPPLTSPIWEGHTDGAIYTCSYRGPIAGTGGSTFWAAAPLAGPTAVDPVQLARQALQTLVVPPPSPGRYPAGTLPDGRPYTVVRAPTWFWTNSTDWRPLTARADVGGVWAQVTVTPTRLSFSPGDGGAAASCPGPGTSWDPGFAAWTASPSGCDYSYARSSVDVPGGLLTARYGITWQVSWTSSTGASGQLPELTTTSTSTFAVVEEQTVVTR